MENNRSNYLSCLYSYSEDQMSLKKKKRKKKKKASHQKEDNWVIIKTKKKHP